MILGRPILPVVFLVTTWFAYAPTASGQRYGGRELVKAELIADATAVVPGKPFTVGLLLHMVPGWHTYWKYSGDAGLPTELKWTLPPGWKIGEIQWPIPPLYAAAINSDNQKFVGGSATCGGVAQLVRAAES